MVREARRRDLTPIGSTDGGLQRERCSVTPPDHMHDKTADDSAPRQLWRWGAIMLLPLVALITELALRQRFHPSIWFLFYPAVFFSSWIGGLRGALAASLISIVCVLWFLLPPGHASGVAG